MEAGPGGCFSTSISFFFLLLPYSQHFQWAKCSVTTHHRDALCCIFSWGQVWELSIAGRGV